MIIFYSIFFTLWPIWSLKGWWTTYSMFIPKARKMSPCLQPFHLHQSFLYFHVRCHVNLLPTVRSNDKHQKKTLFLSNPPTVAHRGQHWHPTRIIWQLNKARNSLKWETALTIISVGLPWQLFTSLRLYQPSEDFLPRAAINFRL